MNGIGSREIVGEMELILRHGHTMITMLTIIGLQSWLIYKR
jgi:hypothetical protein